MHNVAAFKSHGKNPVVHPVLDEKAACETIYPHL